MEEKPVERLFPFVLKTRILVVGREALHSAEKRLLFILLTTDISPNSFKELTESYPQIPFIQKYTSEDIARHFGFYHTKVLGFLKSPLANSLYKEMNSFRIKRL